MSFLTQGRVSLSSLDFDESLEVFLVGLDYPHETGRDIATTRSYVAVHAALSFPASLPSPARVGIHRSRIPVMISSKSCEAGFLT